MARSHEDVTGDIRAQLCGPGSRNEGFTGWPANDGQRYTLVDMLRYLLDPKLDDILARLERLETKEPEPTPEPEPEPSPEPVGTTAAEVHGWGDPIPEGSDEFTHAGPLNPDRWYVYGTGGDFGGQGSNCWPGHAGNGRRCVKNNTVADGMLTQHGQQSGDTAGISMRYAQHGGRWECRVRSRVGDTNPDGHPYHVLCLLWPAVSDGDVHSPDGEYDFWEIFAPNQQKAVAFMHPPNEQPGEQKYAEKPGVDATDWHNVAFEWVPDQHVAGFIDGVEWFRFGSRTASAPNPMVLCIQTDCFYDDGDMQEAYFDIAWARTYRL